MWPSIDASWQRRARALGQRRILVHVGHPRLDRRRDRRRVVDAQERQLDAESTAGAERALDGDVAAHAPRQLAADRQAEPGAARARLRVARLLERLEDALLRVGRDARPLVAHLEAQAARRESARGQPHLAALAELHRVAGQVEEDLDQAPLVAAHANGRLRRQIHDQHDPLRTRLDREQVAHRRDERGHVHLVVAQVEAARLDLGQIEQVVDEREEVRAAATDRRQGVALHPAEIAPPEQRLRVSEHGVERRAQLVAHVGEELALGAARHLGPLARDRQLRRALAHLGLQPIDQGGVLDGRSRPAWRAGARSPGDPR